MPDAPPLLLLFDLDETLLYGNDEPLERPPVFEHGGYHVYIRPHAASLIAFCAARFRIGVWTASSPPWAGRMVEHLFGDCELTLFWTGERCTRRFDHWEQRWYTRKHLTKLRRQRLDLERVLILDNTPRTYEANYGNAIPIPSWYGDPEDDLLLRLPPHLQRWAAAPALRREEKRGWWRS